MVFTTDYYPPHLGGGVEAVVSEVARRLAVAGHEVLVITLGRDAWPDVETLDGVRVHRFRSIRLNRVTGLELTFSRRAFKDMRATIEQFAPDVISAHHSYFTTTPSALNAARRLAIPSVLTLHVAGMDHFGGWKGVAARFYERSVARWLLRRPDALVAVSEAVAASVRPYVSLPVTVIPNGVDIDRFRPSPRQHGAGRRIVFVGRLIANKGPQTALDAFSRVEEKYPSATLTMVGDGPLRSSLEKCVAERGLEGKVRFLGLRGDVAEILNASDVLVRPSLVEGMPLTILEAMASGLPVIASDVGGVSEIVSDGNTGYLIRPRSHEELAEALVRMFEDDERMVAMGSAGMRRVRANFSWDITASATERLLEALVGTRD